MGWLALLILEVEAMRRPEHRDRRGEITPTPFLFPYTKMFNGSGSDPHKTIVRMEKAIICLSGPGNTGKTTSVRKLYELLGGSSREFYPDVVDSVEYHDYTIGCMSIGDPGSAQEERLEELLKKDCDIVVTASRSYGGTVDILNNLADRYNYKVIRFSQIYLYEDMGEVLFNLSHEANVKLVLTIIDKLIAGEAL